MKPFQRPALRGGALRVYWKDAGAVAMRRSRGRGNINFLDIIDAGGILPAEFYKTRGSNNPPLSGEQKLLLMMLVDATETIGRGNKATFTANYSRGNRRATVNWVNSAAGAQAGPKFSFDEVCWHLGLDASATRKQILSGAAGKRLNELKRKARFSDIQSRTHEPILRRIWAARHKSNALTSS